MCDPVTVLATAAVVQGVGQVQQGRAAKKAADQQASLQEYQALVEQDNALAQAQQIRRQGASARGAAVAAVGASGVKVGQGSTNDIERQVMQDYEADASMAILTGNRAAAGLRADAELTRRAGRNARNAAYLSAAGSLLSAGANGAKAAGWSSNGPGFSGTQAPAPVETRSTFNGYGGRY